MSDNSVFQEVQAALLNSECDPNEAGSQGLCALYSFVATELEGTKLHEALTRALNEVRLTPPGNPGEERATRKALRAHVLANSTERKRRR